MNTFPGAEGPNPSRRAISAARRLLFTGAMNNFIRSTITPVLLVVIALAGSACQKKIDAVVDDRQVQINNANSSLVRMEVLNEELRQSGVWIERPFVAKSFIRTKSLPELQVLQAKLNEYVLHARKVLEISTRPDLSWGDQRKIEERLAMVQVVLTEVNLQISRISNQPVTQFDGQFWATWSDCRSANVSVFEIHGIRVWRGYSRFDDQMINRMSRRDRQEASRRLRLHMQCESILSQGNSTLYGPVYKFTPQKVDTPAEFEKTKNEVNNIEGLVKKLDEGDTDLTKRPESRR